MTCQVIRLLSVLPCSEHAVLQTLLYYIREMSHVCLLRPTAPAEPRSKVPVRAQPSWKFPSAVKRYTIRELSCYHGALRGVEAEEKLKQQPGDSHLIRYSDSRGEYILSVLKRGANGPICQHFVIKILALHDRSKYSVEGSDMEFHDASEMLEYFRKNHISFEIDGIGKPCQVRTLPGNPSNYRLNRPGQK